VGNDSILHQRPGPEKTVLADSVSLVTLPCPSNSKRTLKLDGPKTRALDRRIDASEIERGYCGQGKRLHALEGETPKCQMCAEKFVHAEAVAKVKAAQARREKLPSQEIEAVIKSGEESLSHTCSA
jgi:hypothetical protein